MSMGPGRNEQELSRAEQMVKGLSPKAVQAAVFGAAHRVAELDLTGNQRVNPEDLKDIELAQEGLKAYHAAGVKQGADLPARAEAANPASGRKLGGALFNQAGQFGVALAATAAIGPSVGAAIGIGFAAYEAGKMTGLLPSRNPASRPGDDIAAAGMRGYSTSPQKKGSMVIGGGAPVTGGGTSFAKSADRTPQASLTGVGRADVLGNRTREPRPSPFDKAFDQVQITPESFKAGNKLATTVDQQARNAGKLMFESKMNSRDPNVVADKSPLNHDFDAQVRAYQRGGRVTLLEAGTVSHREAERFLDGQHRRHEPTPDQRVQLAAVAPKAAPAPVFH